jgi:hypothetical protein
MRRFLKAFASGIYVLDGLFEFPVVIDWMSAHTLMMWSRHVLEKIMSGGVLFLQFLNLLAQRGPSVFDLQIFRADFAVFGNWDEDV